MFLDDKTGQPSALPPHMRVPHLEFLSNEELVVHPPEIEKSRMGRLSQGHSSHGSESRAFTFDRVFPPPSTQQQCFEEVAELLPLVLQGTNVCVFAYGQTGSGKTYTMEGTSTEQGLNYRALNELFAAMEARVPQVSFEVHVSCLEIYNDTLTDLLSQYSQSVTVAEALDNEFSPNTLRNVPFKKELAVREGDRGMYVKNITRLETKSAQEVKRVLIGSLARRRTASTALNMRSSRSHVVLTVEVEAHDQLSDRVSCGKLSLVDLAGSERVKKSGASGEQLIEASFINKSLSALGNVLRALGDANEGGSDSNAHSRQQQSSSWGGEEIASARGGEMPSYVPYRDSKLTYFLKDTLSAGGRTVMFVHTSPAARHQAETLCSLRFGANVRRVKLGSAVSNTRGGVMSKYRRMAEAAKQREKEVNHEHAKLEKVLVNRNRRVAELQQLLARRAAKKVSSSSSSRRPLSYDFSNTQRRSKETVIRQHKRGISTPTSAELPSPARSASSIVSIVSTSSNGSINASPSNAATTTSTSSRPKASRKGRSTNAKSLSSRDPQSPSNGMALSPTGASLPSPRSINTGWGSGDGQPLKVAPARQRQTEKQLGEYHLEDISQRTRRSYPGQIRRPRKRKQKEKKEKIATLNGQPSEMMQNGTRQRRTQTLPSSLIFTAIKDAPVSSRDPAAVDKVNGPASSLAAQPVPTIAPTAKIIDVDMHDEFSPTAAARRENSPKVRQQKKSAPKPIRGTKPKQPLYLPDETVDVDKIDIDSFRAKLKLKAAEDDLQEDEEAIDVDALFNAMPQQKRKKSKPFSRAHPPVIAHLPQTEPRRRGGRSSGSSRRAAQNVRKGGRHTDRDVGREKDRDAGKQVDRDAGDQKDPGARVPSPATARQKTHKQVQNSAPALSPPSTRSSNNSSSSIPRSNDSHFKQLFKKAERRVADERRQKRLSGGKREKAQGIQKSNGMMGHNHTRAQSFAAVGAAKEGQSDANGYAQETMLVKHGGDEVCMV